MVGKDVQLSNGLAFSPDGRRFYHSDSLRRTVFKYAVNPDGTLGQKVSFARVRKDGPDGLALAEDGTIWVALAGGGQGVSVFKPDGTASEFIEIPKPLCTSVCFGDDDFKTLYIVSGSEGAKAEKPIPSMAHGEFPDHRIAIRLIRPTFENRGYISHPLNTRHHFWATAYTRFVSWQFILLTV